jgi:hypothetical protein
MKAAQNPDLPLPWVSGLRPPTPGKDWREATAAWILGDIGKLPSGKRTSQAETGLGIEPSHYWYVLRAERQFGYTVFLSRASIDGWLKESGGMTPFDSGGLWHGFIPANPASIDSETKKSLFNRYNRSLIGWPDAFCDYIAANYDDFKGYIQGLPPRTGSPPIMTSPPSSAQAWTWEARVTRKTFRPEQVQPLKIYWHLAESDHFLNWVETASRYDDPVQEQLTAWVLDSQEICPTSESPAIRAGLDLVKNLQDLGIHR